MTPLEKRRVTIEQARLWFEDAWPKQSFYPGESQLNSVAIRIDIVLQSGGKAPKRPSVLGNAHAPLKKFLKEVPTISREITVRTDGQTSADLPPVNGLAYPPLLYAAERLREAEAAVKALVEACEPIPWMEPARFIAEAARDAWFKAAWERSYWELLRTGDTSDATREQWRQKQMPTIALGDTSERLSRFVALALNHIKLEPTQISEATISESLRGRNRDRRRSSSTPGGGRKNAKLAPT